MSKTLKLTIIMGLYRLIVETGVFAQPTLNPKKLEQIQSLT